MQKTEDLNCWFWIDCRVPEEERKMSILCEDCHEDFPNVGYFWEAWRGYGPWNIKCGECGKVIHKKEADEE